MIGIAIAAVGRELGAIGGSDARLSAFARRTAPLLAALSFAAMAVQLSPGGEPHLDRSGALLGHDLAQVWVAGRTAFAGAADRVYDFAAHGAELVRTFGPDAPLFGWHYPPVYFLPAMGLATLPYPAAVALWAAGSVLVFALAIRAATDRTDATIMALAHPLVFCALSYGQNSLVTASCLALGLAWLDRRPVVAGILLGLACYKPQLAALAPFLCLVTGRWRVLGTSLATMATLATISLILLGPSVWLAFLASIGPTGDLILRDASAGLDLNASAFGAVRLLGGPLPLAWAAQSVVSGCALGGALLAWRRTDDLRLRAAVTLFATVLMTPYLPVYDLAILLPGFCLLALAGAAAGSLTSAERALLIASVVLTPPLRSLTGLTGLPLGFGLALAAFSLATMRAAGRRPLLVAPNLAAR